MLVQYMHVLLLFLAPFPPISPRVELEQPLLTHEAEFFVINSSINKPSLHFSTTYKRPGLAWVPPGCWASQSITQVKPSSLVTAALATLKRAGGSTSRGRREHIPSRRTVRWLPLERDVALIVRHLSKSSSR
ncbi:hypothetical protein SNK03_001034 [Fusarium graminearum]|uniref:Chromosome 1, complete genome n=2 Tax=Gibberella zeae TaxID=5518 RepID=I1RBG8_GIBZE|nr:hypothetical protein FGSG_00891 [Fusarium graminearum PH-1]EYB26293.1 hypothetical protein FG05_00891 [Fusarium graminearum]ESU06139.1 hypothetical protein FGSG_00891 [Fusarium graminearum PH-1]CAF3587011.1 unnamed protein product [Fusarium graminearum]CAF3599873.1 unnamed protein product [Fusarium graminearum]CAG1986401.1 unnamed protein product [Fusarium graminearum]|eukprot:XP_011316624.1 hypothetical protein FGSG_00891 [Fusarium graminearum PH-1]